MTAEPDGVLSASENVLPVSVKRGADWVAVSTRLVPGTGGRLSPDAVPGDAVSFSSGGTSPMAEIAASGTSLALWWPGQLPTPTVFGPSAVYRNVLPGVNLVLTATSVQTGGFSEVLVVGSRTAARDPGLARLSLRVTTSGTTALRTVAGGGLTAAMTKGRGWYTAAAPRCGIPPRFWRALLAARPGQRGRGRGNGRDAGPGGSRPDVLVGWPGGWRAAGRRAGGRIRDGSVLSLTPDARMLAASSTRFPVYIDPSFTVDTTKRRTPAGSPTRTHGRQAGL